MNEELDINKVLVDAKKLLLNAPDDYRITLLKSFILFAKEQKLEYLPIDTLENIINL